MKDLIMLWDKLTEATKDMYIMFFSFIFAGSFFPLITEVFRTEESIILAVLYFIIVLFFCLYGALMISFGLMYILTIFKRWWKE